MMVLSITTNITKLACCIVLALSAVTGLRASNRVPFSKNKLTEVPTVSDITGKGVISFSKGSKPGILQISINTTVPVIDGNSCLGCGDTLRMGPNLKAAVDPFLLSSEAKNEMGYKVDKQEISLTVEGPNGEDAEIFIVSGPKGATLKKDGNAFLLLQGEAYLLTPGDEAAADEAEEGVMIGVARKVPEWAKGKMQLKVLKGTYKLKGGAELWAGSEMYVYEKQMTFPAGLTITVGKGGSELKGKSYAEGVTLTVTERGLRAAAKKQ